MPATQHTEDPHVASEPKSMSGTLAHTYKPGMATREAEVGSLGLTGHLAELTSAKPWRDLSSNQQYKPPEERRVWKEAHTHVHLHVSIHAPTNT